MNRSKGFKIIRLIVSVGLIAFLIHRLDIGEVGRHLKGVAVIPLVLAALADFAMISTNSLRWATLLRAREIRVPQVRLLYYYLVGNFFSAFLPTSVGGDVVRVVGMSTETERRADVLASVVVERLLGFFVLLPIGLAALPFVGRDLLEWRLVVTVWVIAGLIFAAAYVVLLRPVARRLSKLLGPLFTLLDRFRARERVENAYEAIVSYRSCRRAVGQGLALSLVSRLLWISGCFLVARAFSLDGIGVREATFVAMLGQFGVEESLAFAYSVAVYVVFMVFALVGGLLYGTGQFLKRS
jgi:uncharacterized protein (TIRG00374 family)